MFLVYPDGTWVEGAEAMLRCMMLHPGWKVLAAPFLLWPLLSISERVYRWIADNRTRIGSWCGLKASCSVDGTEGEGAEDDSGDEA